MLLEAMWENNKSPHDTLSTDSNCIAKMFHSICRASASFAPVRLSLALFGRLHRRRKICISLHFEETTEDHERENERQEEKEKGEKEIEEDEEGSERDGEGVTRIFGFAMHNIRKVCEEDP